MPSWLNNTLKRKDPSNSLQPLNLSMSEEQSGKEHVLCVGFPVGGDTISVTSGAGRPFYELCRDACHDATITIHRDGLAEKSVYSTCRCEPFSPLDADAWDSMRTTGRYRNHIPNVESCWISLPLISFDNHPTFYSMGLGDWGRPDILEGCTNDQLDLKVKPRMT